MESEAMRKDTGAFTEQSISMSTMKSSPAVRSRLSSMFAELTAGVRQDLISYLDEKGFVNDPDILVIPSTRHYFYDADDLKGVKTMVNLKPLNYVREIRDFLRRVSELLPDDSNFVGCFTDNKLQNGFSDKYGNLPRNLSEKAEAYENGIESRIPFINRMYSFIDLKTNRYLTGRTVANLLEESGLQIIGMTERNGLTYFHSRKKPARIGLIA
ncbi:MAG: hypothetical protein GX622_00490 [Bacteroidales bacterium]|nr:hypothetical protein [Bacteroidales bacterium]